MREVDRLVDAGLVTTKKRGHSRIVSVATANPLFRPLSELIALSFRPGSSACSPRRRRRDRGSFHLRSWAARYHDQAGHVPGDLDVLVIGSANRDELYDIAADAGHTLRREVNIRRMTRAVWDDPANAAFRSTVQSRPVVSLNEDA